MPVPNWPLCLIEVYEEPGFIDDGFRTGWSAIAMANEPLDKHFWTTWDVVGDVAEMYVKESASSQGAGYRKDVSAKSLATNTYPMLRARMKGADTQPYYKIKIEYTDASATDTGWVQAATDAYFVKSVELASGKTVKYVELYAKSGGGSGAEAKVWWDYVAVLRNPPLVPHEVEELDVDLQTTVAVSGFKFKVLNDPLFASQVLRFPFDEGFGIKAYDLSRYKNRGTVYGASWVDGKFGKALNFDGDDYVTIAHHSSLSPSSMTIEAWVRIPSNPTDFACILDKENFEETTGYGVSIGTSRQVTFHGGNGSTYHRWNTGAVLNLNQWHHIVCIWANNTKSCYLDGVFVNSVSVNGPVSNTVGMCIGKYSPVWNGWWFTGKIDEVHIYDRALTGAEVKQLYQSSPRSGVARAGVGDTAMIYLAASDEALEQKLVKGRIGSKESSGEPDNPTLEFTGRDMAASLQDRTFTKTYDVATEPSQILKDALDAEVPELTYTSVEATNNPIKPRYREQNIYALARDYAQACKNASGIKGFDLWVDPGDDVRFKTLCAYTCPHRLSDGSDGYPKNIKKIRVRETDEEIENSVKVVIYEEEYEPKDRDSYTENKERWTLGGIGSSLNEDADAKRGNRSIKATVTGLASFSLDLSINFDLLIDITQAEKLKYWIKSSLTNVDPNSVNIILYTEKSNANRYEKTGLGALPSSWEEKEYDLLTFTKIGNPSKVVTRFHLGLEPTTGNTLSGSLWIDGFHFVLPEKSKTSEDSASIGKYGKRKKRYIRKEITDESYAQYLATNLCEYHKNPLTHIEVTVLGKAQPGYRPPQKIIVASLKDNINQKDFRILRARHHYIPGNYACDLELISAKTAVDTYEPKTHSISISEIGKNIANMRRMQEETVSGIVRGEWSC